MWNMRRTLTFRHKFSVGQKRHIIRMFWNECVSVGIDLIVHAHCILRCIRFSCGCRLCLRTVARIIFVGIRQQQVPIVSVAIELLMLRRLLQCIVMVLLLNRRLHHTDRSWLLIIHLTDARIFAVCVAAQLRFETVILYFGCGFAQAAIYFFGIHGWRAIVRFNRRLTRARTCSEMECTVQSVFGWKGVDVARARYLLEWWFCKLLNGPSCGLSNNFGLEQDNGDDGLFVPDVLRRKCCWIIIFAESLYCFGNSLKMAVIWDGERNWINELIYDFLYSMIGLTSGVLQLYNAIKHARAWLLNSTLFWSLANWTIFKIALLVGGCFGKSSLRQ